MLRRYTGEISSHYLSPIFSTPNTRHRRGCHQQTPRAFIHTPQRNAVLCPSFFTQGSGRHAIWRRRTLYVFQVCEREDSTMRTGPSRSHSSDAMNGTSPPVCLSKARSIEVQAAGDYCCASGLEYFSFRPSPTSMFPHRQRDLSLRQHTHNSTGATIRDYCRLCTYNNQRASARCGYVSFAFVLG